MTTEEVIPMTDRIRHVVGLVEIDRAWGGQEDGGWW